MSFYNVVRKRPAESYLSRDRGGRVKFAHNPTKYYLLKRGSKGRRTYEAVPPYDCIYTPELGKVSPCHGLTPSDFSDILQAVEAFDTEEKLFYIRSYRTRPMIAFGKTKLGSYKVNPSRQAALTAWSYIWHNDYSESRMATALTSVRRDKGLDFNYWKALRYLRFYCKRFPDAGLWDSDIFDSENSDRLNGIEAHENNLFYKP